MGLSDLRHFDEVLRLLKTQFPLLMREVVGHALVSLRPEVAFATTLLTCERIHALVLTFNQIAAAHTILIRCRIDFSCQPTR